jgi:ABC-type lipoprotein export system ATPase subunit
MDLGNASEKDLIKFRRETASFIYQSYNLLEVLTNRENVSLPADFGIEKAIGTKKARSKDLLKSVGLDFYTNGKPSLLSGGQQQRVTIARALMNQPKILFADEPTGDLDSVTGSQIMDIIEELHRDGVTVVLVTHDEKIAQRAQRIIHMSDGKVVEKPIKN